MIDILVVENREREAARVARFLQRAGYQVSIANDVVEAKRLVRDKAFDFALVDMGIAYDARSEDQKLAEENSKNGLDLMRWVQGRDGIIAFALTGSGEPALRAQIPGKIIEKPLRNFDEQVIQPIRLTAGKKINDPK